MEKAVEIGFLYGFYAPLLTERQRELMELYYHQDLSLAEIADQTDVSRQGVRDALRRGSGQLYALESALGLGRRYRLAGQWMRAARRALERNDKGAAAAALDQLESLWEE